MSPATMAGLAAGVSTLAALGLLALALLLPGYLRACRYARLYARHARPTTGRRTT